MLHEIVDSFLERPDASPEALLTVALDKNAAFNDGPMRCFVDAVHMASTAIPTSSPGFRLAVQGILPDLEALHAAACVTLGLSLLEGCHIRRDAWLPLTWLLVRNLPETALVGLLSCDAPGFEERFFGALHVVALPVGALPMADRCAGMAASGERTVRLLITVAESGFVSARLPVSEITGVLSDVSCPASGRKLRRALAIALKEADMWAKFDAIPPSNQPSPLDVAPLDVEVDVAPLDVEVEVAATMTADAELIRRYGTTVWYDVMTRLDTRTASEVRMLTRDPALRADATVCMSPTPRGGSLGYSATSSVDNWWTPGCNGGPLMLATVIDAVARQCPEAMTVPHYSALHTVDMADAGVSMPFWVPLERCGSMPFGMHVLLGFRSDTAFTGSLQAEHCMHVPVTVRAGLDIISWIFPERLPLPTSSRGMRVTLVGMPPGAVVEAVGLSLSHNAHTAVFFEDSVVPGHVEMRRPFMLWHQLGWGMLRGKPRKGTADVHALWKPIVAPP
jgi:hypothetical protein